MIIRSLVEIKKQSHHCRIILNAMKQGKICCSDARHQLLALPSISELDIPIIRSYAHRPAMRQPSRQTMTLPCVPCAETINPAVLTSPLIFQLDAVANHLAEQEHLAQSFHLKTNLHRHTTPVPSHSKAQPPTSSPCPSSHQPYRYYQPPQQKQQQQHPSPPSSHPQTPS